MVAGDVDHAAPAVEELPRYGLLGMRFRLGLYRHGRAESFIVREMGCLLMSSVSIIIGTLRPLTKPSPAS